MRLKIVLRALNEGTVPYNKKRALNAWIYNMIKSAEVELAEKMHDSRQIKFFTFSDVFLQKPYSLTNDGIAVRKWSHLTVVFSAWDDNLPKAISKAMIKIANKNLRQLVLGTVTYDILFIEGIAEPEITEEMEFGPVSPISVSTEKNEKIVSVEPTEEQFFVSLKNNLEKKYRLLFKREYGGILEITPLWKKVKSKRFSKAVDIKGGLIKAYYIPLRIKGKKDIMRLAYVVGVGEKNSMGFGMLDVSG